MLSAEELIYVDQIDADECSSSFTAAAAASLTRSDNPVNILPKLLHITNMFYKLVKIKGHSIVIDKKSAEIEECIHHCVIWRS